MSKRKRHGILEINLTSLLDVLFCILFIVMLKGAQNEKEIRAETHDQLRQMQEQIITYKNQINTYDNQAKSYDIYNTQAVIVTMSNIQENNTHKLLISKDDDRDNTSILLGSDRLNNVAQRIQNVIGDILDATDNQPIYIIFHCNRETIYTREYNGIIETLTNLQSKNKEVFYQVVEG